ncbi:hypothetical protein L1887_47762 [Cichorium endivia]|nr:hypothetical protein L1887_47762 [Cichorium endivia]
MELMCCSGDGGWEAAFISPSPNRGPLTDCDFTAPRLEHSETGNASVLSCLPCIPPLWRKSIQMLRPRLAQLVFCCSSAVQLGRLATLPRFSVNFAARLYYLLQQDGDVETLTQTGSLAEVEGSARRAIADLSETGTCFRLDHLFHLAGIEADGTGDARAEAAARSAHSIACGGCGAGLVAQRDALRVDDARLDATCGSNLRLQRRPHGRIRTFRRSELGHHVLGRNNAVRKELVVVGVCQRADRTNEMLLFRPTDRVVSTSPAWLGSLKAWKALTFHRALISSVTVGRTGATYAGLSCSRETRCLPSLSQLSGSMSLSCSWMRLSATAVSCVRTAIVCRKV